MAPWKVKANRVIGELCYAEYRRMNYRLNGERYKKHRQYSVPDDAVALIECLDTDNEQAAKAIFIRMALEA